MRQLLLATVALLPMAARAQTPGSTPTPLAGLSFTRFGEPVFVQATPGGQITTLNSGSIPRDANGNKPTTYIIWNTSQFAVRYAASDGTSKVSSTTGNLIGPMCWRTQTTVNPTAISAMTVPSPAFPTPGNATIEFTYGQGDASSGCFNQLMVDQVAEGLLQSLVTASAGFATASGQQAMATALQAIQGSVASLAGAISGSGNTSALRVSVGGTVAVSQSGTWTVADTAAENSLATIASKVSGTLTVGGTVSLASGTTVNVGNLPATQPVSGSVSVSNFPATQPVSGSVSVSNLPATQNTADTALDALISGTGTAAYLRMGLTQALPAGTNAIGTVGVTSLPALVAGTANIGTVNGSTVSVTNLPATQAVSAASLPLPTGAATDASLTNGNLRGTVVATQGTTPWTTARTPPPGTLKSCAGTTSGTANTSTALLAAGNWTRGFHGYVVGASGIRISYLVAAGTTLTDTNSFVIPQGYTFANPDWMPAGTPITVSSTGTSQAIMCEYN